MQIGSLGLTLTSLKQYYLDRAYLNDINAIMILLSTPTNLNFMISLLFKYLEVNITFRFNAAIGDRIKMQLGKSNRAFLVNKVHYYIKNPNTKVELLCYKILIRLVIFYAFPVWSRPASLNRLDVLKVGTLGQVCAFTVDSHLGLGSIWVTLCFIILQQCWK